MTSRNAQILDLYLNTDMTIKEIGDAQDPPVSRTRIYQIVEKMTDQRRHPRIIDQDARADDMAELYHWQGLSMVEIAEVYDMSPARVLQIFQEYSIPRRSTIEIINNKNAAKLQQARDLQAQGLHQYAIAREIKVNYDTIRKWIRKGLLDQPQPWTLPHQIRAANIRDDYYHAGVPVDDLEVMYGVTRETVYRILRETQN